MEIEMILIFHANMWGNIADFTGSERVGCGLPFGAQNHRRKATTQDTSLLQEELQYLQQYCQSFNQ